MDTTTAHAPHPRVGDAEKTTPEPRARTRAMTRGAEGVDAQNERLAPEEDPALSATGKQRRNRIAASVDNFRIGIDNVYDARLKVKEGLLNKLEPPADDPVTAALKAMAIAAVGGATAALLGPFAGGLAAVLTDAGAKSPKKLADLVAGKTSSAISGAITAGLEPAGRDVVAGNRYVNGVMAGIREERNEVLKELPSNQEISESFFARERGEDEAAAHLDQIFGKEAPAEEMQTAQIVTGWWARFGNDVKGSFHEQMAADSLGIVEIDVNSSAIFAPIRGVELDGLGDEARNVVAGGGGKVLLADLMAPGSGLTVRVIDSEIKDFGLVSTPDRRDPPAFAFNSHTPSVLCQWSRLTGMLVPDSFVSTPALVERAATRFMTTAIGGWMLRDIFAKGG